jgi:hypothetical protein
MNHIRERLLCAAALLAVALLLPGCLLVRVTEQRIRINESGGGEAVMRLTDIRSDGATDSSRTRDFGIMMASVEYDGAKDFERRGRKVTAKDFAVSGDTLSAEIAYTFPSLESVEGVKKDADGIYVVVPEGREIVRTNGNVQSWVRNSQRISWPKDARRLSYVIREHDGRAGTSLASYYRRYAQQNGSPGAPR